MSASKEKEPPRVPTGISGLDHILGGGLSSNRLYLVQGDPGSGKTTLGLQFLLAGARRGEPGVYVTLSETKEELAAVACSHGWSLDALTIFELGAGGDGLAVGEQYTLFHPSEVELNEFTRKVLDVVSRVKPVRAVFDSLSEMRLLARDPLRYRRQILALKQFFIGRQCTVLLLDDGTAAGGDLQLQSIAHGVLNLEHVLPEFGAAYHRLRVMKMRGAPFRQGYHDFTIQTGGVKVYPRLGATEHRPEVTGEVASSGVPELDALLGGGIQRGTSTLIMGPAGSGKSAISSQIVDAAAKRGEKAAIFTFEESLGTLLLRADGLGMGLREQLRSGLLHAQQVDPGELAPGQFVCEVLELAERDQASVVVIDSLNGYLNAIASERSLSILLHELFSHLAERNVATLLTVTQHGFLGEHMGTPADVSYLADTVMLLRYFEAGGRVRKAISVVKKRRGGHEHTIRELQLGPGGVRVGQPLEAFQGVLTGVPMYTGTQKTLLETDGGAER